MPHLLHSAVAIITILVFVATSVALVSAGYNASIQASCSSSLANNAPQLPYCTPHQLHACTACLFFTYALVVRCLPFTVPAFDAT